MAQAAYVFYTFKVIISLLRIFRMKTSVLLFLTTILVFLSSPVLAEWQWQQCREACPNSCTPHEEKNGIQYAWCGKHCDHPVMQVNKSGNVYYCWAGQGVKN